MVQQVLDITERDPQGLKYQWIHSFYLNALMQFSEVQAIKWVNWKLINGNQYQTSYGSVTF